MGAVEQYQEGDIIQLLPDETNVGSEGSRVIRVREPITLEKSLTIDLNGQRLELSNSSITLDEGVELVVTGSGKSGSKMTGGELNSSTELYKTIGVGTKNIKNAFLKIIENADVNGVENYGTVELETNGQVSQIAQLSGNFTLDTVLRNSLEVVLDFGRYGGNAARSSYDNPIWLTTGENFAISENSDVQINFRLCSTQALSWGKLLVDLWLKDDKAGNLLYLIKGTKVNELAEITSISDVSSGKTVITTEDNALILLKNEGVVYVGGDAANDDNSGYFIDSPVASMDKAVRLAKKAGKKIYLVGTVHVTGNQIWDIPEGFSFEYEDQVGKGSLAIVEEGGSLTLQNIELKGKGSIVSSSYPLIQVKRGGKLFIEDGAVLSGNYYKNKNGGAVYNEGGDVVMTGGTIENCLAYNGGAIYCEGGTLEIKGNSVLTKNYACEAGGAVMLANGAHMTLSGNAVISNNIVRENGMGYGGGIAVGGLYAETVETSPTLTMTGGTVQGNGVSQYGGGIFVQCNARAEISGGNIIGNDVDSGMYGGGGIYVNGGKNGVMYGGTMRDSGEYENGVLRLTNAVITGNNAINGGGGIAGCPTSNVSVLPADGAIVYGNTTKNKKNDDIYIATDLSGSSTNGIFADVSVSQYMSDGTPYHWKDENGKDVSMKELNKETVSYFSRLLQEKKTYIDLHTDASPKDTSKAAVYIKGNTSKTMGGGIGTNGTVIIGTSSTNIDVTAQKVWSDNGNEDKRPTQIRVWLLRKQQGADDSTYERIDDAYLEPDAEGNWGTAVFEDQPVSLNGVSYEYKVEEDTMGLDPAYQVAVTKDAGAENSWTIMNTYKRDLTGTAQVSATKSLEGRVLREGEFRFSLTPVSAVDADGTAITDLNAAQTVANAANGAIAFKNLSYTQAGTYTYSLKEESTDEAGVTTDPAVYTVTVVMADDGVSNTLHPTVTYSRDGAAVEAVTFVNTYREPTGTAQVVATKTLTGRDLKEGEFQFSLTPVSAVDADGTAITDLNAAQTVANAANGAIAFKNLSYTQAGTYTYSLKEESTDEAGVTTDPAVYTVTVVMADDGVSNTLHPTVTYSRDGAAVEAVTFVNTYREPTGTAQVVATKTLTGRDLKEGEFQFSLTPAGAVDVDGTEITDPNAAQTVANAANGTITFKNLSYTQAGTYTYTLKEEGKEEPGVTTDSAVYTVTVVMADDGVGDTLHPTVTYSKDGTVVETVTFVNAYRPADGSISLGATKAFDRALAGGEFRFVLQEVDAKGAALAGGVHMEAANDAKGAVQFDAIAYHEEGTHRYQVSETAGSDPTILSYDATVYTVTVTVKDVDAKLVATPDQTADKVVFTNSSTRVRIDKRDAESGASIPGAVLRVVERDPATGALGAVVEEWTTDGTPHELLGKLSKNGSYELIEVSAPDGYLPTGPVDFTVNENGETVVGGQATDTVVMLDTKNTVSVLKVDEQGAALSGAHLVIENAAGEAVDSWVSDGAPHVTRGLARGHYALSEVEAPSGYHVAEDVPFDITGAETQPVEVQMSDTKIPEKDKGLLTVTKHLHLDGVSCDIGLHEAVFYVALFSDEAKTHRVSDVKAITINDNSVGTATFENLGKGIYYLGETDENGLLMVSKIVNDQVIYYPEYDKSAKVELETRKDEKTAELTNVYLEVPSGFYLAGRLNITKKVLVGGEEGTSEDTFYARVFSDKALTVPASDVIALEMKGAGEASATVYDLPIGETLESSATYYVAETDESGTPLDPDEVTGYEISIDKKKVVLSADNSIQDVVITNDFVEEEETETSAEEGGTTPGSGSTAPKTGDETDYMRYLCYMLLSAGLFGAVAGQRRRKARRVKK